MVSLCLCEFSADALVSPNNKTCMLGVSPVSTVDQGIGSDYGVRMCGCPLLLRDALNAEITFHCTLYIVKRTFYANLDKKL